MPVIHTVTLRPVTLDIGVATEVFIVGGDTALSDDSDATFIQVTNLDGVNGQGATVQFPGLALPVGALSNARAWARYGQVTGTTEGAPSLTWVPTPAINSQTGPLAAVSDGVVENYGNWINGDYGNFSDLFPNDPVTPQTWNLGMSFDLAGPCDFRIYEMALEVSWYLPRNVAPPRRLFPRHSGGSARVFPPPNTQQAGRRFGSGAPL